MTQVDVAGAASVGASGYKVDVGHGQRIGRVSSEWFSRPPDERYLSLDDLFRSVRERTDLSHTRTLESAAIQVEASRDDSERLALRLAPPPKLSPLGPDQKPKDDWTSLAPIAAPAAPQKVPAGKVTKAGPAGNAESEADLDNAGIRREPELPEQEEIAPRSQPAPQKEFDFDEPGLDQEQTARNQRLRDRMIGNSRQAALDPDDGMAL